MRPLLPLALLAALAGCLGGAPAPADGAEPPAAPGPALPWSVSRTVEAWFLAAEGVPFQDVTVVDGCEVFEFDVPVGTASLALALSGDDVDTDGPGAGRLTFMHRPKGEEWRRQEPVPASSRVTAAEADPAPGAWEVWVWPVGAVVNVRWDLTVALAGVGAAPDLNVRATGFSC